MLDTTYHGTAFGPVTSRHCPSVFTCSFLVSLSSLSSLSASSSTFLSHLFPIFVLLNPHFPTHHRLLIPKTPMSPVGATTHPIPVAKLPMVVADSAATMEPTTAYLAYRITRQNIKTVIEWRVRRRARVRNRTGFGEVWELGEIRYWMFWVIEVRALELRSWAVRSVAVRDWDWGDVDEGVGSSVVLPLEGDMLAVIVYGCFVGDCILHWKCSLLSHKQIICATSLMVRLMVCALATPIPNFTSNPSHSTHSLRCNIL